jgi:ABC-type amino acid transport system permease subunit
LPRIVAGKLEAGLVLTIFAVASGAFVEQVMIIVHLPRIVKATVDPVVAAVAVVAVEVVRVLPMLELHTISTTLSKMDGT